ncbi:MAG: hypothetical protein KKE61_04820, partial [Proteobacteria bacterium]|nr:hypothetical protein [Pseudomonadota bacterium]
TESGAGIASSAGDAEALSKAVLTMYQMSKEDREAMGMRGKAYCDANFEREMLIDKLEGWMTACIQSKHNNGQKA